MKTANEKVCAEVFGVELTADETLKNEKGVTPAKPVFGHRSGKVAKTHWVCFVKDF